MKLRIALAIVEPIAATVLAVLNLRWPLTVPKQRDYCPCGCGSVLP